MDAKIAEQILDELAPTFEGIESRSEAILHFLKDKGIATDEELAPYLEQAAAASSVRWRALRVRMGRLFSLAEKSDEEKLAKKVEDSSGAPERKPDTQGVPEPWNKNLANSAKAGPAETHDNTHSGDKEKQPLANEERTESAQEATRKPAESGAQAAKQAPAADPPSSDNKNKNAA